MAVLAPLPSRPTAPLKASVPTMSKSSKHPQIKRRPTLKRSIDETSFMDASSSPSKRSRVTFDTDVEILSDNDDEDLDPLVVKEQVRRAIQRHILHDNEQYEKIRSVFMTGPDQEDTPSSRILNIHIQAVLANISLLTTDCSSLVHTVLNSDWIGRDDAYFGLFVKFLGNLAAAQGGYVNKIMQVLVDLLGPQKTRRIPDLKPVRQNKIHRRSLQTTRYITQLVPTASGALAGHIRSKLNFDFEKADDRMIYIKNFMDLIAYVPELTSDILTGVLRQLIKLDTTVQSDLDNEEDDAEDEILQHMSASQTLALTSGQDMLRTGIQSDEDDDASTTDESDDDEPETNPLVIRRQKLKEGVKQVDMIMDMLFSYYSQLTTSTDVQVRFNTTEQLISQFHNLILPTNRSRHPQFLIFHFAQGDPIIVDQFVTSCVAILIEKKQPQFLRHAAAAHFSGFVGRGAHVPPSLVQSCTDFLCEQLTKLRKEYEPTCRGPDLKRYGDFYSIFQAIMYIFCFRWRDIGSSASDIDDESDVFEDDDGKDIQDYEFPENLREALHTAIHSPLNPLRVCTPAIVEQFAKITTAVQFMYLYSKIEENKRVRLAPSRNFSSGEMNLSQMNRDMSWVGDNGMLEGYFPYDPYHLPISKHWIENDYVEWQGLPGELDDSDSDSDEDDYDIIEDTDTELEKDLMEAVNY